VADGQTTPMNFCPYCGARRDGDSLVQHCIDRHDGDVPLSIRITGPGEYFEAASLLRANDITVTMLAGSER
jgi:hypothetical protein